jgi:hypothetical protein
MRLLPSSIVFFCVLVAGVGSVPGMNAHPPIEYLKTLEIICYVPGWLPQGFKLERVVLTYDEPGPDEGSVGRFPLYGLEYSDGRGRGFTIDCAREGIGDRNLMDTEDTDEITIKSLFGPMYLIYTPKGKGKGGRKTEVKANWASDANMKTEKAKSPQGHPILGRYHGFSATGITVAEFEKIIHSLHPIRP